MKTVEYSIYHIDENLKDARHYMFASLELLEHLNLKFSLNNYRKVYDGEIDVEDNYNESQTCEMIYVLFNMKHPEDYKGHSMSTGDVIKMNNEYYFCDSFGFTKVA